MKKHTLLYLLLAVLLLANSFFLFKHFGDKPNHRDRGGDKHKRSSKHYIARKLNFNESQLKQYESLKAVHRDVMETYEEDIRVLKDGFFGDISDVPMASNKIDSIASLISNQEKLKDIEVHNHLQRVFQLCDDDQKKRFNSIIKEAIHKRGRKGGNGSPRKGHRN